MTPEGIFGSNMEPWSLTPAPAWRSPLISSVLISESDYLLTVWKFLGRQMRRWLTSTRDRSSSKPVKVEKLWETTKQLFPPFARNSTWAGLESYRSVNAAVVWNQSWPLGTPPKISTAPVFFLNQWKGWGRVGALESGGAAAVANPPSSQLRASGRGEASQAGLLFNFIRFVLKQAPEAGGGGCARGDMGSHEIHGTRDRQGWSGWQFLDMISQKMGNS